MATLLNLRKVQHGCLTWQNGKGSVRSEKPILPSVNGTPICDDDYSYGTTEPLLTYAKQRNLLDIWTPHVTFEFAANHRKTFKGNEALRLWNAYKGVVYAK